MSIHVSMFKCVISLFEIKYFVLGEVNIPGWGWYPGGHYDLQFGFRQNFFTAHAFTNITENIRLALDEGYTGPGIFVDL